MNPDYLNQTPDESAEMEARYKQRIWTDVNGTMHPVDRLSDAHLKNIIKLLEADPDRIINDYKSAAWLPMMLAENTARIIAKAHGDNREPFPPAWNSPTPYMVRPNEREYHHLTPLTEFSETIYDKYHCVVLLLPNGYRQGYVGVRKDHPAYLKSESSITSFVHGGLNASTHQVATFRSKTINMWYFRFTTDQEGDYPDIYSLEKYQYYWAEQDQKAIAKMLDEHTKVPFMMRGHGLFTVRTLDFVKEQLVQLVLELEQFQTDYNKAQIVVPEF
jgi:hypothetical protein